MLKGWSARQPWIMPEATRPAIVALVRDLILGSRISAAAESLQVPLRRVRDPSQLAAQLIARLARYDVPSIEELVRSARTFAPHSCLVPVTPSLTPPGPLQHVLAGHTDDVTVITTSSDEQRLMAVSRDGAVIEWDLATRQPRKRIDLPGGVLALALSVDTRRAVVLESRHLQVRDVGIRARMCAHVVNRGDRFYVAVVPAPATVEQRVFAHRVQPRIAMSAGPEQRE